MKNLFNIFRTDRQGYWLKDENKNVLLITLEESKMSNKCLLSYLSRLTELNENRLKDAILKIR